MRLEWSPLAKGDLHDAVIYIGQDNPRAADEVEDRILAAAESLVSNPAKGRHGRRRGTREWVLPSTPYLLVYRQTELAVEIVRVWHMSRDRLR
ncbi:type II toxin-antitoxin system RelE/ParE family toxin [Brevundimonas sp.]|uniref:type II toxin-antitoxin system RelE/ParE family toxin n=1 Tax=Brevundimonas sp. TaxID=1871086 RepID=UPI002ABC3C03|nr:type II toxin-antitoxin system RelE/ParE family toxin [Brevundimonas sp.]MDZ4364036.1 type II toxin-antitoxin system RelE/ParE family toxin [Brevundimonas sp.]